MPDQALSKIHHLAGFQFPAVRKTLHHFLNLSQQEHVDIHELIAAVELDPTLLAVFISSNGQIDHLADWHAGISVERFRSTALNLCNYYSVHEQNKKIEQHHLGQWQRSLMQGALAASLADHLNANTTEHRLMGLCAGLGHHLLSRVYENTYFDHANNCEVGLALDLSEREQFGVGGNLVAAQVMQKWGYASSDVFCYQYSNLDALAEASQSVQIVAFAGHLLDFDASNNDLLSFAAATFSLSEHAMVSLFESAKETVSKSVVFLESFAGDNSANVFSKEIAAANIGVAIDNALAKRQMDLAALANLVFGIRTSMHLEIQNEELVAITPEGDSLSISLNSKQSQIVKAYKGDRIITAEREVLSSIVEKQILQRLGTSAICILPLDASGLLVCGVGRNQSLDSHHLESFRSALRGDVIAPKAVIALETVQAKVSEVTHEVNNPLAIVQNYLHTLSLKIDEDSPVQGDIETISREMLRVSGIVKKYGQIGHQADLLREEINVNDILSRLSNIFQGGQSSIEYKLILDAAMPLVSITPDSLKQVIVNLLKNAGEALQDVSGGEIIITSHGSINFGGEQFVEILIQDNGPGIPLAIRDKLFQINNSSKGSDHSGLGLSIAKQLMSDMDGMISCRTQVEGEGISGTTFQILIPLVSKSTS